MRRLIAFVLLAPLIVLGQSKPRTSGGSSSSASSVTPSVTFGTKTVPGATNLSTEGTIDWCDSNGLATFNPFTTSNLTHRKVGGDGMMSRTLVYFAGGAAGVSLLANSDGPFTKTTTAADDAYTAALSATTYTAVYTATASQTGYGFQFEAPATTTARTLKLFVGVWSGTITITATLSDGTTANTTIVTTASASMQQIVPITYTASSYGQTLQVKVVLTTNLNSSPNVQFYAATLSN